MFDTVLIANRGEIAVRVARAARALGLRTVAVYSDADRAAPHVRAADAALRIGPAPAAESYLRIDALLDAAARAGAGAVHPGYGFLSEDAAFARACERAGLVFVGPPSAVLARLGRKDEARRLAIGAGVSVAPGIEDAPDEELLARAPVELGFPLIVKPAAGGGGKGMRVVRAEAELRGALAGARRAARAAFGDGALLLERLIEPARHVEVQFLADAHGAIVHVGERDCSLQRRHQKVLEESPAPGLSPSLRAELSDAAVALARAAGYVNAGTAEFLLAGERFVFLEINARLQVEHPVTELAFGVDLVECQLRIARGEPLPFTQTNVRNRAHAIEARIYAEDPDESFLPQAGVATTVMWPRGARVDGALEPGQRIDTWYDPLLAKVIAHGPTREAARRALVTALDDTAILGVTTNLGFLRRLADCDAFRAGALDTSWLDANADSLATPPPPEPVLCAAAWALAGAAAGPHARSDPWAAGDGWRAGGPAAPVALALEWGEERYALTAERAAGVVHVDGRRLRVRALADAPRARAGAGAGALRLELGGEVHAFTVEAAGGSVSVVHRGQAYELRLHDPRASRAGAAAAGDGAVSAPMPGTILSVSGHAGQAVRAGETVVVMEAMKMELALAAPFDGALARVGVAAGERVPLGHPLFEVEGVSGEA